MTDKPQHVTFERSILSANVSLEQAPSGLRVVVSSRWFTKSWDVPVADAKWVRDAIDQLLGKV